MLYEVITDDAPYHAGQEHRRLFVDVESMRSLLAVPMLRGEDSIGVILICNPPYGERMGDFPELIKLYQQRNNFV